MYFLNRFFLIKDIYQYYQILVGWELIYSKNNNCYHCFQSKANYYYYFILKY